MAVSDVKSVISDFGSETVALIDALGKMETKIAAIESLLEQVTGVSMKDSTDTETEETTEETSN